MYPVSARFLETVRGSHRAVARARLVTQVPQYTTDPVGQVIKMISGSVRLLADSDVKAQLTITVPGDWWPDMQPLGAELFVERGVAFGDGQEEYVPLGYFPVDEPAQDRAPYGPVSLSCDDRIGAMIRRCRIVIPWQIPTGTTHRQVLERIVNGSDSGVGTYGMYRLQGGDPVPIHWTDAGYDPDAASVDGQPLIDDSGYEYIAKLVGTRDCVLRFRPDGQLEVVRAAPAIDAAPTYHLRTGRGGTLKRWSRRTSSRDGPNNVIRAVGSDPANQTGYRLARLNDPASSIRYDGPYGPRIGYLASPLLQNDAQADLAAATRLARSSGLPTDVQLWTVPNPAHQALDVVSAPSGTGIGTFVLAEVSIPLVGGGEAAIRTRTLNPVAEIETPEDPEPTPGPDPGPGPDPDSGPGPGPGPGDPDDGTQAAIVHGWGAVIDGDEFVGNVIGPKWGLYNGPGHANNGLRRDFAFSQADGILTITGDNNDVSGGAAFQRGSYGYRVEWRARVFQDGDAQGRPDRYHPVLILWPDSDQWPYGAEYDHFETDEGSGKFEMYMHLPNHEPYRQDYYSEPLDVTAWHNYACHWDPVRKELDAFVDGRRVYTGRGRVAEAPGPMHPTFQLDHFGGRPRRCKFQAKWVRIYTPANA